MADRMGEEGATSSGSASSSLAPDPGPSTRSSQPADPPATRITDLPGGGLSQPANTSGTSANS